GLESRFHGLRNKRLYIRVVNLDVDGCRDFPRNNHFFKFLAFLDWNHIRRTAKLRNMLITGKQPGDGIQVYAVLMLEDPANPDAGRDSIASMNPDLFAFKVLRSSNT